jgi:hypothetical protein
MTVSENLKQVRYRHSIVDYENRKHFFTDWSAYEPTFVDDLTAQIGSGRLKSIVKMLNVKENGTNYLPGIESVQRTINYIPPENIDETVLRELKRTGSILLSGP